MFILAPTLLQVLVKIYILSTSYLDNGIMMTHKRRLLSFVFACNFYLKIPVYSHLNLNNWQEKQVALLFYTYFILPLELFFL